MSQAVNTPAEETKFRGWLHKNFRKSWFGFSLLVFLSFLSAGLQLLNPWPLKILIDSVFGDIPPPWPLSINFVAHTVQLLAALAVIYFLSFFLEGLLSLIYLYLSSRFSFKHGLEIKTDFFSKILKMPSRSNRKLGSGDYVYRLNEETNDVPEMIYNNYTSILEGIITIVAALVILILLNWQLAIIGLLVVPLLYFSIKFFTPRIETTSTSVESSSSEIYDYSSEAIDNIEVVQAFNREAVQTDNYQAKVKERMRLSLKLSIFAGSFEFANNLFTGAAISAVLLIGGYSVFNGNITTGELIIFISYMNYFFNPLQEVVSNVGSYRTLRAGARRVFSVINASSDTIQSPPDGGILLNQVNGHIIFNNTTLRYKNQTVLGGVNFEVKPGQKVAFIGPSGSGKSTVLSLLPRFIQPDSGFIYLDGHEIRTINLQNLRDQVAFVGQEPGLFSGTIHENIAFAKPTLHDMNDVVNAARAANAFEFIDKLPDKFESKVGDMGDSLSGGQKQRIAIARAFLKNAPILILDEPTSAQDPNSETKILSAITQLMQGKTVLIATHQMSLLRQMDAIYIVQDGQIMNMDDYGGLDRYMYHLMAKRTNLEA